MDLQIPPDKKLEDIERFIQELFCSRCVLLLLQTDSNSSKYEDNSIDLEECTAHHIKPSFRNRLLDYFNQFDQMSIAGNSSSHSTYVEDYLAVQGDFQCGFVECPPNPRSRLPITCAMKDNQHIRVEIMRRLSSFVLSTVIFLGISYHICSSLSSVIHVPPLHKEWDDRLSIWLSLLGLFGFMVFVCAVAVMILVRAPFTVMQKAMLIFWAILSNLQSANSIIEVFVSFVGALLMVCFWKSATTK